MQGLAICMHVLMGVQCRGQQVDAFNQQLKSKPLKQRRWTAWRGDTSDIELHPLGAHQQLVPVDSPHEGRGKDARRSQFQRARPSPLRNFAGCSEITCNYISIPCASTLPSRRCYTLLGIGSATLTRSDWKMPAVGAFGT